MCNDSTGYQFWREKADWFIFNWVSHLDLCIGLKRMYFSIYDKVCRNFLYCYFLVLTQESNQRKSRLQNILGFVFFMVAHAIQLVRCTHSGSIAYNKPSQQTRKISLFPEILWGLLKSQKHFCYYGIFFNGGARANQIPGIKLICLTKSFFIKRT